MVLLNCEPSKKSVGGSGNLMLMKRSNSGEPHQQLTSGRIKRKAWAEMYELGKMGGLNPNKDGWH